VQVEQNTMSDVRWDAADGVLISHLAGTINVADVERWKAELGAAVAVMPDGTSFGLLSDLSGYEPAGLEAHKAMRTVIPLLLAEHGFRTGLVDLVGAEDPAVTTRRGITCVAVAHVHHDAGKMALYDERIGRATERFFTDPVAALAWVRAAGRP
jgi:hypothetical protein